MILIGLKKNETSPDTAVKHKELHSEIFTLGTSVFAVLSIVVFVIEAFKLIKPNLLKNKYKPTVCIIFLAISFRGVSILSLYF